MEMEIEGTGTAGDWVESWVIPQAWVSDILLPVSRATGAALPSLVCGKRAVARSN